VIHAAFTLKCSQASLRFRNDMDKFFMVFVISSELFDMSDAFMTFEIFFLLSLFKYLKQHVRYLNTTLSGSRSFMPR
jgi:hypothetical protein